jgi:hypothetical protein
VAVRTKVAVKAGEPAVRALWVQCNDTFLQFFLAHDFRFVTPLGPVSFYLIGKVKQLEQRLANYQSFDKEWGLAATQAARPLHLPLYKPVPKTTLLEIAQFQAQVRDKNLLRDPWHYHQDTDVRAIRRRAAEILDSRFREVTPEEVAKLSRPSLIARHFFLEQHLARVRRSYIATGARLEELYDAKATNAAAREELCKMVTGLNIMAADDELAQKFDKILSGPAAPEAIDPQARMDVSDWAAEVEAEMPHPEYDISEQEMEELIGAGESAEDDPQDPADVAILGERSASGASSGSAVDPTAALFPGSPKGAREGSPGSTSQSGQRRGSETPRHAERQSRDPSPSGGSTQEED